MNGTRRPEIMADAAHAIFCRPARETTGNFFIDDEVLAADGVTDLEPYSFVAGAQLIPDLYVEA
jgi:citronellol/citronellal dehydrogenase